MTKDVKDFVSKCEIYKISKPTNQIMRPPMGQQMLTERPFQRVYMDLLGPYPRSKMGNNMMFVAIDHFSKYIFFKPLRKATSANIISFIEDNIFHQFGVPQYMHSDNGKQFVSAQMTDFLNAYGVIHIRTALYSPQANCSERTNREFLIKLRILLEKRQDKWDIHVSKIASSDYHESIKCSPYFCVFGTNMILHGSTYPVIEKLGSINDKQIQVLPNDTKMEIHDKVRDNLVTAHERA